MTFQNPRYLVETGWLEAHLHDADLRILDCTVYMLNYFEESAAEGIEVVSGREHWDQERIRALRGLWMNQDKKGNEDDSRFSRRPYIDETRLEARRRIELGHPESGQRTHLLSQYGIGSV